MTQNQSLCGVSLVLSVLILTACASTPTEPSDFKTYKSVWINARWTGGRTGSPTNTKSDGPGNFTGTYCPLNSMILENHSSRYESVFSNSRSTLVFKNTCSMSADLLVCVTAASGGHSGDAFSEFPVCNVDPRTTPLSRLESVSMGPGNTGLQSTTWRSTGIELDVNIFYCGIGDAFTVGIVSGANPTDCLQH